MAPRTLTHYTSNPVRSSSLLVEGKGIFYSPDCLRIADQPSERTMGHPLAGPTLFTPPLS